MADFLLLCALIIIVTLPGIVLGLMFHLSPIRRRIRQNNVVPARILVLGGCLSFILAFGINTRLRAEIDYAVRLINWGYQFKETEIEKAQQNKGDIVFELWLRYLWKCWSRVVFKLSKKMLVADVNLLPKSWFSRPDNNPPVPTIIKMVILNTVGACRAKTSIATETTTIVPAAI